MEESRIEQAVKFVAFTIVLDGEPFIERHLPVFQQLTIPWQWIVVEGAAGNTADTYWCKAQEPRLSRDGTHEYLESIEDRHVIFLWLPSWPNKTEMCNAALSQITEPCVLMQIDADEIWTVEQLENIAERFHQEPRLESIQFPCNYFVGPDLLLQGENCYGDMNYEWIRAWRFSPGDYFISHEPPSLFKAKLTDFRSFMGKHECRHRGLVFNHFPYVTEAQVAYKEKFYGYAGLLGQWKALQAHKDFPVPLSRFFSHVSGDLPKVIRL